METCCQCAHFSSHILSGKNSPDSKLPVLALVRQAAQKPASAFGLPFSVTLTQDVEEEGVHIIVQGFVVQEQFAEQAQALAVHLVLLAIHLTYTLSSTTGHNANTHSDRKPGSSRNLHETGMELGGGCTPPLAFLCSGLHIASSGHKSQKRCAFPTQVHACLM